MAQDPARSEAVASRVAARHRLSEPVVLLRSGMNDVYRAGEVVLRVAPGHVDGQAQVEVAQALHEAGLPIVRPLADAVRVDGAVVTLWEHVEQPEHARIDYRQVGEVIARLHGVDGDSVLPRVQVPWCGEADWLQLDVLLERAASTGVVDDGDLEVLATECDVLADWQQQAREDALVLCHGDVHPQNLVVDREGRLVILDWDGLCRGPAAWDHAALLTWEERWGGEPGTYEAFASGYGEDLRGSPLARMLARVRLLAPTLNQIVRGRDDPRRAAEARRRMRFWRGDPDAPAWRAQ